MASLWVKQVPCVLACSSCMPTSWCVIMFIIVSLFIHFSPWNTSFVPLSSIFKVHELIRSFIYGKCLENSLTNQIVNHHQGTNSSMLQLHCTAALEGVDLGKTSQLDSSKLKKILRERVHMSAWRIWMNMTQIACVMCKVRASPSADSPRGSQKPTGACTPNSPARSLASQKNRIWKRTCFHGYQQISSIHQIQIMSWPFFSSVNQKSN